MSYFRLSRTAARDLTKIAAMLGPYGTAELVQDLQRTCCLLAQFPEMGWPLKKRRKFPVGKYHILVYQPLRSGIEVKRVVDGRSKEAARVLQEGR